MPRPLVRLFATLLILPSTLSAQQNFTPLAANSPKGFDQQYKKILKAYDKGNEQEIRAQFQTFIIPKHWFTDMFGPDQGPKLADQYWELFLSFVSETTAEFQSVGYVFAVQRLARLETKAWTSDSSSVKPAPKPPPISLLTLPSVQHFQISYRYGPPVDYIFDAPALDPGVGPVVPGQVDSWVQSFIYVDGAFRFFGGDTYPFWDSCSRTGPLPGGHLSHRVTAIYPKDAPPPYEVHPFLVRMRLTVAEDGSLKEIAILEGNPILVGPARQAVLQWRYEPFLHCGEPVEKQLTVFVDFRGK